MDDRELLRHFVGSRSQDAFRQLVERHLPMVYGAAQRMVRDSHLAEEVAQNVFTTLAQKAGSIRPPQVVGGWLYNTTRHLAMHAVRSEQRRREREQTAIAMQALDLAPDNSRIAEHLEPAMAELEADDRDALVLRYLENRSLREVGAELGISEDAARMRVNRALERLREGFGRQGVTATTVLLATTITATTSAVPAGLAGTITTTALAAVATATLTQATVITMNWLNAKAVAAMIGAAVIAGTGTYFIQQQKLADSRAAGQSSVIQQQQSIAERDQAYAALKAREQEVEALRKDASDLPRLRNEISQLRRENEANQQRLAQKAATAATRPPPAPTPIEPGQYISKEQLAFAGYETPEACWQSFMWAALSGNYEAMTNSFSPNAQKDFQDSNDRIEFEQMMKTEAVNFKGMQILARKVVSEDKIELKIMTDETKQDVGIEQMVKVGNEWKRHQSVGYPANWDKNGTIQTFKQ